MGKKGFYLDFKPLIKSPYCQTIFGTTFSFGKEPPSETLHVQLKDGDVLAVEVSTPENWKEDGWTIYLVHGLCGSHRSHYMNRVAKKAYKLGYQAVRINMRGCGSGRGLARNTYHSGSSGDVREVIEVVNKLHPKSTKALIGFSLGANISLKLAGELGEDAPGFVDHVIAVGAPCDLLASARRFMLPKNQIYAKYFLRAMLNDVYYIHEKFPDLPPHNLPPDLSINDFDELYVAPRANFTSALEYYHHSSSKRVVKDIVIPAKVLFARDDPIISANALDDVDLPENVEVYKTDHGGHIGFLGQNVFKDFRWMDNQIMHWLHEWKPREEGPLEI